MNSIRFGRLRIRSSFAPLLLTVPLGISAACGGKEQSPPRTAPPVAAASTAASSVRASSPTSPPEAAPTLHLPSDTHPISERLVLTIDPNAARFSGHAEIAIALDRPRSVIWLNGSDLAVTRVSVVPEEGAAMAGQWAQTDARGVASITLPATVSGKATIDITYDAAFEAKLEGVYKSTQGGSTYIFTQFEPIAARRAFPCFDEPGFKIPYDVTLEVPAAMEAIANAGEIGREAAGASKRVHFAPTLPLPSYLVTFAVGPLDVVDAPEVAPNEVRKRPLKLRGIATKGRGKELGYTLAHTGEILATLERYFGIEYPYDKLDVIAVPDKGGAMENAGAMTFDAYLVLFDEKTAPLRQRRAFANVMAHELAHQWVGDLVTASFWDDLWLNEAFASWTAAKAADAWNPKSNGETSLLEGIQHAMGADALVSARSVRQPIATTDDITNAFDGITYQKGAAVLSMFERWLGRETFQRGVHDYLEQHRFKSATSDDFLDVLSHAAGKDVRTPFHTFLDQPGVPFVEVETKCDEHPRMHLKQSRYLPIGSAGDSDKTWQLPICARYKVGADVKEACTLLTEKEGDLPLGDRCPEWTFPNADAAGYFRFDVAPGDRAKLEKAGLGVLSVREKVAYANSLRAGFNRATTPMKESITAAAVLASDPHPELADDAMWLIRDAREWLYDDGLRPAVEAYARKLYHAPFAKLGWTASPSDDEDARTLRASLIQFLAADARDPAVRAEAKKRSLAYLAYPKGGALHPEALDKDIAGVALFVTGEEADIALWEAIRARFVASEDDQLRAVLLGALSAPVRPELSVRARELSLDPALRVTEVFRPVWTQLQSPETREATWQWLKLHYAELVSRVSAHRGALRIVNAVSVFCDELHARDAEEFFTPRIKAIEGGPRALASALETVHLCAARRRAQESSARELFGKRR